MKTSKNKSRSIQVKLLSVVMIPIVIITMLIILLGVTFIYHSYSQSIRDELSSTTNILIDCLNLTVRGDYSYEDNMLLKGDLNITDSTMLYNVKKNSAIDTTIFWQDTRILSTVENKYGVSAVGTKASSEVTEAVLRNGENYFSNNIDINGVPYIGYYTPLQNDDHTIVGMVFAGKDKQIVNNMTKAVLLWFVLISLITALIAILLSRYFSNKMITDINGINSFLKTISEGDLSIDLDNRITERNDELGSIGQYASRMRDDLKKMIERDPLTSLYNRRSCKNRLNTLESQKKTYSIVMCDIDWFKNVNDSFGHDAGDYVLVHTSKLISDNIKDCGFASRWGGEEFLLIYNADFDKTKEKVRQLQQSIREYDFHYGEHSINITMTFGIEAGDDSLPYEERIKEADHKLYDGKNNGRDQIVC